MSSTREKQRFPTTQRPHWRGCVGTPPRTDEGTMSEIRIPIDVPGHATSLVVRRGGVQVVGSILARESIAIDARRVLVVVDASIAATHAPRVVTALERAGARVAVHEMRAREETKSMREVEAIWSAALEARLDRGGLLVALGGGLVGDVAGFAAATYLRGIDLVQIPTTLLAMVDASIGGKTGVNLALPGGGLGKNLAGAFWQPKVTIADADLLTTLSVRELRAGLAECAKHAVIAGGALLAALEADARALAAGDVSALDRLIPASASVKAAIVARDPHELGERALLNLGHTFGHAIETVPALQLLHGEAVAIGMVAAAHCAHAYFAPPVGSPSVGSPNEPLAVRVERLLSQLGLPIRMPLPIPQSEIRHRMGFDKKNQGGVLRLVLARKMGDVTVVTDPPEETVLAGLAAIGAAGESAM